MQLITGASGTLGGAVLTEVARSGQPHCALYRSAADAAKASRGTRTLVADFADKGRLAEALHGIESVYLVCAPIPELVQLEGNVIEAAEATGVRRIVLSSALGAGDYPKSFPSWHRKVEDKLRATRLAWCILRPNSFMQNVAAFYAPSIRAEGAFYAAMRSARVCYIDVRDVAAVAAKALRGESDGEVFELHGPEGLTCADVAEKISRHAGVSARFVDIPAAAQRQSMLALGMPEWQVTALLELQEYYTVAGKGGTPDGTLERLLGRAPRNMEQFIRENATAFRSSQAPQ
jgi:uncharacterized protein YbjT (DUF2867 family)